MMKKTVWLIAVGLAMLLVSGFGCAVADGDGMERSANSEAIAPELELGNKMLAAFSCNKASDFVSLLPAEMQRRFGKDAFDTAYKNTRESLGEVVSFGYFGELETPVFRVLLWKVRFRRETSDKKTIHQEALFRVVTGRIDDVPQVVSFGFL